MNEIVNSIIATPDGGTVSPTGLALPSSGYLVGGAGPVLIIRDADALAEHRKSVEGYVAAAAEWAPYIGWWTDPETGKVYVDCTTWHDSVITADIVSAGRGEIAFYDIEGGRSITTGDSGVGAAA